VFIVSYVGVTYRVKRVLESRRAVDEDRISDLELKVTEEKESATTSEHLLLEVRIALI